MIEIKKVYVGEIVSNNDPEKGGRVQVKIGMFSWLSKHYPWVRPWKMGIGASNTMGRSEIPSEKTKVWVFFTDELRKENGYYLADSEFLKLNPHLLFDQKIKNNITLGVTDQATLEYPHVKFTVYENNLCTFVCDDPANPFFGVFHPSGSQFIIDKKGEAYIGAKGQTPDKVVSSTKLKAYFSPRVGNFGAALFPDIGGADLGFDHFYAGLGTVPTITVPDVPTSRGQEAVLSPDFEDAAS